ncbi:DUF1496 domain-containing protein [Apirhabdus apintestini]|nr:DUF1496 domain-containing protein [Enterobacteriaceae bacterium CA-0114]
MIKTVFTTLALCALSLSGAQATQIVHPRIDVDVPPEAFAPSQRHATSCLRCCVYQDRYYSEGAVIKMEGVLLQCRKDDRVVGNKPPVWQLLTEQP